MYPAMKRYVEYIMEKTLEPGTGLGYSPRRSRRDLHPLRRKVQEVETGPPHAAVIYSITVAIRRCSTSKFCKNRTPNRKDLYLSGIIIAKICTFANP